MSEARQNDTIAGRAKSLSITCTLLSFLCMLVAAGELFGIHLGAGPWILLASFFIAVKVILRAVARETIGKGGMP